MAIKGMEPAPDPQ